MGGASHKLARILIMLLMFVATPLQMWAADYYQGVRLTEPSKSGDVYLIENRNELLWWVLNAHSRNIQLMADINVQGDNKLLKADGKTLAISEGNIVVWPHLNYEDEVVNASSNIEGNNHTISGIYQKNGYGIKDKPGAIKACNYVGFISKSDIKLTISNLNIADSYLEGKYAGGFIACKEKNWWRTFETNIKNCTFRGYVKGEIHAGGICGWYRTDGQDINFYRCINYGTIEAGKSANKNKEICAGGLIGYLDIARTNFAKAHTNFNRCVNYGNVTALTPGGSVGGIVGKVWDNNNGKRNWVFCFNFGDIKKYDLGNKLVAGSGVLGNYTNINKAQPKFMGCGNARMSDTGTLLDSISCNYKDRAPFIATGTKSILTNKIYSSIEEDNSGASWWNNHWGTVAVVSAAIIIAVATAGIGAAAAAASAKAALVTAETTWSAIHLIFYAGAAIESFAPFIAAEAAIAATASITTAMLAGAAGGAIGGGLLAAIGETYNYYRNDANASSIMIEANLPYTKGDLLAANFAYDANLMMQADSIGGELNTDKSILFKQHIDINEPTKSDTIPTIITNFDSNVDKLYFGYDGCHRIPTINNDPSLLKVPAPHKFDSNGECTYCHMKQLPLGIVYKKEDNQTVDYYTIENESQLNYLANAFNGDNEEAYKLYNGANFKLVADIKYSEDFLWTPIGSCSESYQDGSDINSINWHPFRGNFDGQGHTIDGLKTSDFTNYAGLFGYIESEKENVSISNVHLTNCNFSGNVAGSIAGHICQGNYPYSSIAIDRVTADSSVMVIATCKDNKTYAGGFFGKITRNNSYDNDLTISYCYNNSKIIGKRTNPAIKIEKIIGNFIGAYNNTTSDYKKITFKHCYFGGESTYSQNAVGYFERNGIQNTICYEDCYSTISSSQNDQEEAQSNPKYIARNYMTSGKLAYDLMSNSKVIENGDTTYFFTQKGDYPVLTNTKQPTLCKVNIEVDGLALGCNIQMADTIINTNAKKLAVPFMYAGKNIKNANLMGWNNEYRRGEPEYINEYSDFSELYKTPTRYYTLLLEPKEISAIANIQNEMEWKGAGVLAGYAQTNIMNNLYLQGADAWSLQQAPQCIDGTYKIVITGMPLISDVNGSISSARKYFRARSNAPSTQSDTEDITIQNMRLKGDVLAQDVLNDGNRKLSLKNMILIPQSTKARKVTLDWNTEKKAENSHGYDFKNVVCQLPDSTSAIFYQDGTDMATTTFSEENKNNTYEDILSYLLSHDGMLDVFGLRLSGKDEKAAGKLGFATETNKHIYRATLYNQSTGLTDGEVLLNYDGDVTFEVNGNKLGAMHEGLPDGTFAVLPVTKEELGEEFNYLGRNIITQDGQAACICINDNKTDGFTYPSCFDNDEKMILTANRAEYVRNVHRDGLHESIYLPFAFSSIEYDEKDFSENDKMELSFVGYKNDGLSEDGKKLRLTSLGAYYTNKYNNEEYDPTMDADSTLFIAGIPYMLALKCEDRADELSTITFVGINVGFLRESAELELCEPLYGLFKSCTAADVANGRKVYGLDVFTDEATGKLYDKFVRAKDTDRLDAFRCYLATNSSLAGDDISILVDDGTATGIKDIPMSELKKKGVIFDLSGRRVVKKKPRNIYIQNGKKIINF